MMQNATKAELSAAYTGIVAVGVSNVLPALAGILVLDLGWSAQTIGRFASTDSIGSLAGTLLASVLMGRLPFRALTLAGLAALALADVVSGLSSSAALLVAARLVGGIGGGLAMSISFAVFAATRPERGIALWSIGQLVFGFFAITALPRLTAMLGWQAAFFGLAAFALPGLLFARYLPGRAPPARVSASVPREAIGLRVAIAVAGVALFYCGEGEFWPYLEVMGLGSGIAQQSVEVSLSISAASAIAGSTFVLLAGKRFGYMLPLSASFTVTIAAILSIHSADPIVFRVAIAAFTFAWPVFAAYQFALIAAHDPSARVAAFVTTANWAGLVAGPLVAGQLIENGMAGSVRLLAVALDAAAFLSVVPLMRRARRQSAITVPAET
jgi:DHA1 family inner membrane transport protein